MSFEIHASDAPLDAIERIVPTLVEELVATRLTAGDTSLWGVDAEADAAARLGFIDAVTVSRPLVTEIEALRDELRAAGLTRIVLAGMGGSSLAPEVICRTAGVPLTVLDSTAPGQVLAAIDGDPERGGLAETVLVVSAKSGSTVETDSAKRAFETAFRDVGIDPASRIVVVTDPGSPLEASARAAGYRTFTADPRVGGRYAALTAFGLVPSGLAGADIAALLDEADATLLEVAIDADENPALQLAAAIADTHDPISGARRDKIALIADGTHIEGLPDWIEQLVAESTGKQGRGILPVVLTSLAPEVDDTDLGTVADLQVVRLAHDAEHARLFDEHPGEIIVSGSLGAQFVVWQYATAIAARLLGVNPFDQPDVEAAKVAARALLAGGAAAPGNGDITDDAITVRASDAALTADGTAAGALRALIAAMPEGGYLSVQAYADRTRVPQLLGIRDLLAAESGRPVTFGWGPRFLHSTGQFHKGGPAVGAFVQLIERSGVDLEIPGAAYTFEQLIAAQAAGDAQTLAERGLPVLTLTFGDDSDAVLALFEATQPPAEGEAA